MSAESWDDVIEEAESEHFVGREQELTLFQREIQSSSSRSLIFYITGQGGVGKTTLLNQYREYARNIGFLLADCDELQRDIPAVLGRFAHQLTEQHCSLKRFEERYKVYRQKMHEIENDPEAPQGIASLVSRAVVRASFIVGDTIPGIRKGLEYLPRETVETQASEQASYLAKKLSNKDEIALIRDPVPILTTLFFEDINQIAQKQPVLICFENFEATRQELQDWLLHLRAYKPSKHIRLAIAGREPLMAQWDPLRAVTKVIALDVFTMQEAEAFLDIYGITNKKRRSEIIEWSGRLPVLMSWLSTPQGSDSEPTLPTHDIVERFLRWVTNPTWRQVALLAAIPRTFNIDILQVLLREESRITFDEQEAFDWLRAMPFVQTRLQGWQYHPVVRRMMLRYQRQKSPQRYQQLHTALANFFNEKRTLHPSSSDEGWADEQWREHTLSYLYYFLLADPVQHWPAVISLLIVAIRKRRVFAREIVELLLEEDIYDQLRQEQNTLILLLRGQLQAIKDGNLSNGFEMFDQLCTLSSISTLAKCYIFAYRGESYRLKAQWDKALADFDHAISFDEKYTWALVCRGQTYRQMKRYEEALADFDRAISLDGEKDWILANRGETYRLMKRYEEALADFDRAISLNEKYTWALVSRGETYEAMKHYEEALADFDRAISLGATKFNARGLILSYLERYAEAIESYEQDLKNDSNNIYALYNIAVVQVRWKGPTQSQEFLDKAQKALTEALNTVLHSNALYGLGGIEALLGNIDQALEYLHQAILLNSSNVIGWARHDIAWNDLRMSANPRFEALLSESQESNDNAMN